MTFSRYLFNMSQPLKVLFLILLGLIFTFTSCSRPTEPNNPPSVSITSGPSGTISVTSATFVWKGNDQDGYVQGYNYEIDDPSPDNWTSSTSHSFSGLSEGSHTFYVRAKDNDGDYSGIKSRSFTISLPTPTITMTSPNGGEDWELGSTHIITWSSSDAGSNVKIELYRYGNYYATITSSTSNDGSYTWNIPSTYYDSNYYKIKVSDASNSSVYDYSDSDFSLSTSSPSSITVTSPNGGENWQLGSTYAITWSSAKVGKSNSDSKEKRGYYVRIELYKNGSYYSTITSSTYNDGSYTWSIPSNYVESSYYKIKIIDTSNSATYDYSNNYFSLSSTSTPSITVTSPNGGENWQLGSNHYITWSSSNAGSYVRIELYKNGSYYTTITSSTSNDGSYAWSIPSNYSESSYYKIKITDTSNSSTYDYSNSYFSLSSSSTPSITVNSPNGGENWQLGSTHAITWSSSNAGSYVRIELYKNGSYYSTITSSTNNDGSYSWYLSSIYDESSYYKVKITDTSNSSVYDYSDNYFTLSAQVSSITVTSPNGGENWELGSTHYITWSSSNAGSYVKIELYKNGSYYTTITSSTYNDGSRSWTIPSTYDESSYYKIKITDTSNSSVYDYSDNYFTLSAQVSSITVTSPNGGENWELGSSHYITWSSSNAGSYVRIELYRVGSYYSTITSSTSNDGSYSWSIPSNYSESSYYKIKITDTSNSSIYDYSNNYFTLSSQGSITVTSPNGGENWELGSSHYITWSSSNAGSYVKIELYKSGSYYSTITSSTYNDGSRSWFIPSNYSESSYYKIKITDTSNSSIYDYSDSYFTLSSQPSITVTEPNGGELYYVGDQMVIQWSSQNVSYVRIDFYKNGNYDHTITSSTPSDGYYSMSLPCSYPTSDYYTVKITDTSNSSVYDFSNGYFGIRNSGEVTLGGNDYYYISGNYYDPDPNNGTPWIALSSYGTSGAEACYSMTYPDLFGSCIDYIGFLVYSYDDGWGFGEDYYLWNYNNNSWVYMGSSNKQLGWHGGYLNNMAYLGYNNEVKLKINSVYADHTHVKNVKFYLSQDQPWLGENPMNCIIREEDE
jgi:hypothetical protein